MPGEIGPGDGLARADQLQHNIAVDVARGAAGRQLGVGEIDAPDASFHSLATYQSQPLA